MYAESTAAIVTALNTVTDVGVVNGYRRHATTYEALYDTFLITVDGVQQIRAWDVAWESGTLQPSSWTDDGKVRMTGDMTYVVRGYMSANDSEATDVTFSTLLLNVVLALVEVAAALTPRQSHVAVTIRTNGYMSLGAPGVGTALIHYCEVSVPIREEVVV